MLRTGALEAAELSSVEDIDRLVVREPAESSSRLSALRSGRRTGLKERLPSGVVGAVDVSRTMFSSESTAEGGMAAMTIVLVVIFGRGDLAHERRGFLSDESVGDWRLGKAERRRRPVRQGVQSELDRATSALPRGSGQGGWQQGPQPRVQHVLAVCTCHVCILNKCTYIQSSGRGGQRQVQRPPDRANGVSVGRATIPAGWRQECLSRARRWRDEMVADGGLISREGRHGGTCTWPVMYM